MHPARTLTVGVTLLQMYSVALLCGIGFTIGRFIASLAFADYLYDVAGRADGVPHFGGCRSPGPAAQLLGATTECLLMTSPTHLFIHH